MKTYVKPDGENSAVTTLEVLNRRRNQAFYQIQAAYAQLRSVSREFSLDFMTREEIDALMSAAVTLHQVVEDRASSWNEKKASYYYIESQRDPFPNRIPNTPLNDTDRQEGI